MVAAISIRECLCLGRGVSVRGGGRVSVFGVAFSGGVSVWGRGSQLMTTINLQERCVFIIKSSICYYQLDLISSGPIKQDLLYSPVVLIDKCRSEHASFPHGN